ncbi:hypothetical protein AZE42_13468 [Rhizopogon vesiculosus]|uniref:DUF4939 domain-containing protein n=1 Tax=Rhizopogon vesiculosus TaxID=180088 RepID=A0A1J8R117_9AGAM|nr:hypothetical protein AZE42_13468 [Rhizopogon vesiculosus]
MPAASSSTTSAAPAPVMTTKLAELKIGHPSQFTGEPELLDQWIGQVQQYLGINAHIYDTDEKQIIFALSFMTEGQAESWVDDFTNAANTLNTAGHKAGYGTFEDFIKLIKKVFGPANTVASAWIQITKIKQSSSESLTDYISHFKLHTGRAKLTDYRPFRHLFLGGLNEGLHNQILSHSTEIKTIEDLIQVANTKQMAFEERKNF